MLHSLHSHLVLVTQNNKYKRSAYSLLSSHHKKIKEEVNYSSNKKDG